MNYTLANSKLVLKGFSENIIEKKEEFLGVKVFTKNIDFSQSVQEIVTSV